MSKTKKDVKRNEKGRNSFKRYKKNRIKDREVKEMIKHYR